MCDGLIVGADILELITHDLWTQCHKKMLILNSRNDRVNAAFSPFWNRLASTMRKKCWGSLSCSTYQPSLVPQHFDIKMTWRDVGWWLDRAYMHLEITLLLERDQLIINYNSWVVSKIVNNYESTFQLRHHLCRHFNKMQFIVLYSVRVLKIDDTNLFNLRLV